MNQQQPRQLEMPDVPEIGLHDLFFDKYGFVRRVIKERTCESCGAQWIDVGKYSAHCDPRDCHDE